MAGAVTAPTPGAALSVPKVTGRTHPQSIPPLTLVPSAPIGDSLSPAPISALTPALSQVPRRRDTSQGLWKFIRRFLFHPKLVFETAWTPPVPPLLPPRPFLAHGICSFLEESAVWMDCFQCHPWDIATGSDTAWMNRGHLQTRSTAGLRPHALCAAADVKDARKR